MSQPIKIELGRLSAFYTPTIVMLAGGYLQAEGLEPTQTISSATKSSLDSLLDGSVHVAQSAPSRSFPLLKDGGKPPIAHFAQINERDGFFIVARRADPAFTWDKLKSGKVLVDHSGQPLAMFKYACFKNGVDFSSLDIVAPPNGSMEQAFRQGIGDYVHLQGPAPQQIEADGAGHIVAAVGDSIGPVAFTSFCATREWLATDEARRFTRAYRKAREWIIQASAEKIAELEAPYFPGIDRHVLTNTIASYQNSGCWTPHVEITRSAFETTVDVFQHVGALRTRPQYDDVIVLPPN